MPKPGYYAVRVGRVPGIYETWTECEAQVKGYPGASYKKFVSEELAKQFIGVSSLAKVPNTFRQHSTADCGEGDLQSLPYGLSELELLSKFGVQNSGHNSLNTIHSNNPVLKSASELTFFPLGIEYNLPKCKNSYYAVHRGVKPGLYKTWTECEKQIKDVKNASYRKFDNEKDALEYVRTGGIVKASKRELRDLKYDNRVVKRRKVSSENEDAQNEYVLANPEEPVIIFTDGASAENGKKRARAGFGVYWGPNHPLNVSKRLSGRQTNNRAEIQGAVYALNQAKQIGSKKVKLYTDSQFLIHAITDWIEKWQNNKWRLVNGETVVNKDDFIQLNSAREGLDVEWIYVKAHARNRGNEKADHLARMGAKMLLEPTAEPQKSKSDVEALDINPFILTSASSSGEQLPLILPDVKSEKIPYYAVYRGRCPGIYKTWTDCEKQIKDFTNPSFRKFFDREQAAEFVKTGKSIKPEFKVPEYKPDEFVAVYTDGSSTSNGKEGAQAGIGVYWGPGNELNTSMRLPGRQTNNRAEIHAAVHALRQAKHLGIKNVRLYTDSQFVIKGITTWIDKWKKNGWKLANGKPVVNKDDFIALDEARKDLNVDWCYVKGHDTNVGNIAADKLAVAGSAKPLSETVILT